MKVRTKLIQERPEQAKRRLRYLISAVYVVVLLLIGAFLYHAQLEIQDEMFFKYRTEAESVVSRIEEHLAELLAPEERRAFDEYSFYSVSPNALFDKSTFRISPLGELPPRSNFPALIGFFQINPDGTFQSPVLPNIDRSLLSAQSLQMSQADFAQRLSIFDTLAHSVAAQRLSPLAPRSRASDEEDLARNDSRRTYQKKSDRNEIDRLEKYPPLTEGKSLYNSAPLDSRAKNELPTDEVFSNAGVPAEDKQLRDYNLDESMLQRQQSVAGKFRENSAIASKSLNLYQAPRKEQSWAPQVEASSADEAIFRRAPANSFARDSGSGTRQFELGPADKWWSRGYDSGEVAVPSYAKKAEEERGVQASFPVAPPASSNIPSAPKEKYTVTLTPFEAEVDPMQFIPLSDGRFVFYRKVWRERARYIQGFVVDRTQFLSAVVEQQLRQSVLHSAANLLVAYNNQVMIRFEKGTGSQSQKEQLLYRAAFAAPLASLELVFSVGRIPLGPAAQLLHMLAAVMTIVLTIGLFFIYRLGAAQIDLATKKTDFVSAVSHELKTPLTSIRMYAEILRAGWTSSTEQIQQYYDFIYSESERLSRLISNVLQLSKLTTNHSDIQLKQYVPRALVNLVVSKVDSMIRAAGFELLVEQPDKENDNLLISADEDSFLQIMLNLIDNALKFSKNAELKQIVLGFRIVSRGTNSFVSFFVRDFGPGIPDNIKRDIFTLFYRAESELTRATPGTGIGLALVRELAQQMNATVDLVQRSPGAEFEVTFSCLNRK